MAQFKPRIHVLLARHAPVGVVIRRGPSKSVCTILWDRRRDEFRLGQWLKGRIYERRSDLSPDGKYLIYFAMNGKWDSEAKGAWTAIAWCPLSEGCCPVSQRRLLARWRVVHGKKHLLAERRVRPFRALQYRRGPS